MHKRVCVEISGREYPIIIGENVLTDSGKYISSIISRPRVAIITDKTVAKLHLPELQSSLTKAGIATDILKLPSGENTKSWPFVSQAVEWLLENGLERNDVVLAFGGGVVGDLVGFVAAIFRRGIKYVQIPTTLLSQVDSSIGGKTGINTLHGKNLVGSFHHPSLVLSDISLLDTLEKRDFLAGYGEVVKYGIIEGAPFFDWLEKNGNGLLLGDKSIRAEAVRFSCQMKADIVTRDETEQGERAHLNFGHTFGHALEAAMGFGNSLLHGEGVSIGCRLALELSMSLGVCSEKTVSRLKRHQKKMGMKSSLADINAKVPDSSEILSLMYQDKKVLNGRLRFVLAKDFGSVFLTDNISDKDIIEFLDAALSRGAK
mgnify:CR=1 FL=1